MQDEVENAYANERDQQQQDEKSNPAVEELTLRQR
jgi:hypothetical protein